MLWSCIWKPAYRTLQSQPGFQKSCSPCQCQWRWLGLQDRTKTGPVPAYNNSTWLSCSAATPELELLTINLPVSWPPLRVPGPYRRLCTENYTPGTRDLLLLAVLKFSGGCKKSWRILIRIKMQRSYCCSPVRSSDLMLSPAAGSWWHNKSIVNRRNEIFFNENSFFSLLSETSEFSKYIIPLFCAPQAITEQSTWGPVLRQCW